MCVCGGYVKYHVLKTKTLKFLQKRLRHVAAIRHNFHVFGCCGAISTHFTVCFGSNIGKFGLVRGVKWCEWGWVDFNFKTK